MQQCNSKPLAGGNNSFWLQRFSAQSADLPEREPTHPRGCARGTRVAVPAAPAWLCPRRSRGCARGKTVAMKVEEDSPSAPRTAADPDTWPWPLSATEAEAAAVAVGQDADTEVTTVVKEESVRNLEAGSEAIATSVGDTAKFTRAVLAQFACACDQFGGPAQYLQQRWRHDLGKFAEQLNTQLPQLETVSYLEPAHLNRLASKERITLHASMLGFDAACTTKPLPYPTVAKALAEEYLTHGFLTEEEPLIVWSTRATDLESLNFTMKYVKGMARSCTLLCLLDLICTAGCALASACPVLYSSATAILAKQEFHQDVAKVAIANANLSSRGSIRCAHDVITWTVKLKVLQSRHNLQGKAVLEAFNRQATGRAQITGNRRMAALNLLVPSCDGALEEMLNLLGNVGPEQVWWQEDAWANRRVLPGFAPRGPWQATLRVSPESFHLMCQALCLQQLAKIPLLRRRLDKRQLEEQANLASMAMWLKDDCLNDAPVMADAVEHFLGAFSKGEHGLLLDLQGLLHEKKLALSWRDVEFLRARHSECVNVSDKLVRGFPATVVAASKLEEAEFNLFAEKLEFDTAALHVWRSKLASQEAATYHAKLERKCRRRAEARGAVDSLTTKPAPPLVFLDVSDLKLLQVAERIAQITTKVREVHHVPRPQPVLLLVVTNWAAPSSISAELQELQQGLLGMLLNRPDEYDGLALVFTPVWERRRGLLYMSESKLLQGIANVHVNSDERGHLSFQERLDTRDRRPLEYPMRLCFPMTSERPSAWLKAALSSSVCGGLWVSSWSWIWWLCPGGARWLCPGGGPGGCAPDVAVVLWSWSRCLCCGGGRGPGSSLVVQVPLVRDNRTLTRAKMLSTRDMQVVEDLLDDSIPCSSNLDGELNPADRYSQLGEAAAQCVLESTITAVPAERSAVILVDLSPATGEWGTAALSLMTSFQEPLTYIAVGPATPLEWNKVTCMDYAVSLFLEGKLKISGHAPLSLDVDEEAAGVPRPKLQICGVQDKNLVIPDEHVKRFKDHPQFGGIFQELLQKVQTAVPDMAEGLGEAPKRRKAEPVAVPRETDSDKTWLEADALPGEAALLHKVCVGRTRLTMSVFTQNRVLLWNPTEDDVFLSTGTFCAGFAKGKWWYPAKSNSQPDPNVDLPCAFSGASDMVIYDKQHVPIGRLINARRETEPDKAEVRYHKLIDHPTDSDPANFKLEPQHGIYWNMESFQVQDDAEEMGDGAGSAAKVTVQSQVGATIPANLWNSKLTAVTCHVRWAKKGLTGIRPCVTFCQDVQVPAQRGLWLIEP